ncbi:MAG: geranylgeranylglyceryl/heptaprenylglyceryl phosphate synthase [Candidatus Diapherotrites archaeon]
MSFEHEGKTFAALLEKLEKQKGLLFMQLDPPNYSPEQAGKIAKIGEENGLDAIAVGGSVGAQGELLDNTIQAIKQNSKLPVILFPGNIATLSKHADAMYFMSMLNSTDPYWISGAQISASAVVKRLGVEPIPTSYIIVEPGRAVGWMGRAQPVPRNQPYLAVITALAGQYMGAHLVILESGGGSETAAPKEMVSMVKKSIDVPLLIAGGIRTPETAYETIRAGADIVQVGTPFEQAKADPKKLASLFKEFSEAVRNGAKEKNGKEKK